MDNFIKFISQRWWRIFSYRCKDSKCTKSSPFIKVDDLIWLASVL
uniref:Uncharacterized protein n=1 Tax=Arundo donax TaxID=35708 RepID=A0A0A8Z361_ARUDO